MDLERRVARIESSNAISRLVANYCHGADKRDLEAFLRVWHPDAVWDVGAHRFVGLADIEAAVARQWSLVESMHHLTANSVIDFVSDNAARGRHDVISVAMTRGGDALLSTGQYLDNYRCRDGRWGITERRAIVQTNVALSPSGRGQLGDVTEIVTGPPSPTD